MVTNDHIDLESGKVDILSNLPGLHLILSIVTGHCDWPAIC